MIVSLVKKCEPRRIGVTSVCKQPKPQPWMAATSVKCTGETTTVRLHSNVVESPRYKKGEGAAIGPETKHRPRTKETNSTPHTTILSSKDRKAGQAKQLRLKM